MLWVTPNKIQRSTDINHWSHNDKAAWLMPSVKGRLSTVGLTHIGSDGIFHSNTVTKMLCNYWGLYRNLIYDINGGPGMIHPSSSSNTQTHGNIGCGRLWNDLGLRLQLKCFPLLDTISYYRCKLAGFPDLTEMFGIHLYHFTSVWV